MKYKYFENEWEDQPDWIENAKSTVEMVWKSEYKLNSSNTNDVVLLLVASPRARSARTTTTNITPPSDQLPELQDLPDWKKRKKRPLIKDKRDEL